MRQIFVSYAEADQTFACRLAEDLCSSGANVWLDIRNAEPGRNWTRSIERALSESQLMIVVLSPPALDSAHVNVEWQAYLEANRPVIPVIAQPCNLPGPLRTRRPVDFMRNYSRAFHQLTTRLIEAAARARRSDPVIWTLAENVQEFREEKAPPPPELGSSESEDPVASGIRRMVSALLDRLRPKSAV